MTAFLLHKRTGGRVLFVDGAAFHETAAAKDYTETFDEIVALVKPAQAHDDVEAERRIPFLRDGKSIDAPKAADVLARAGAEILADMKPAKAKK